MACGCTRFWDIPGNWNQISAFFHINSIWGIVKSLEKKYTSYPFNIPSFPKMNPIVEFKIINRLSTALVQCNSWNKASIYITQKNFGAHVCCQSCLGLSHLYWVKIKCCFWANAENISGICSWYIEYNNCERFFYFLPSSKSCMLKCLWGWHRMDVNGEGRDYCMTNPMFKGISSYAASIKCWPMRIQSRCCSGLLIVF